MADMQVGWVTLEEARAQWADAPLDDDDLAALLLAAWDQCIEFLPAGDEPPGSTLPGGLAPARLVMAQLMQARALYRSLKAGSGDTIGDDGMTVTVWPMDRTVKNLLRPKRGTYRVG